MASIVTRVYEDMRNRILNGEFCANDLFVEQSVAKDYQVSRGTAREALQLLCNSKFLIKHPRKGYFIYNFSDEEFHDVLQTRYYLEIGAITTVIQNCTDAQIRELYSTLSGPEMSTLPENTINSNFHVALAALSGNKTLLEVVKDLLDITARKCLHSSSKDYEESHEAIIEALLERNIEKCSAALKNDLRIE